MKDTAATTLAERRRACPVQGCERKTWFPQTDVPETWVCSKHREVIDSQPESLVVGLLASVRYGEDFRFIDGVEYVVYIRTYLPSGEVIRSTFEGRFDYQWSGPHGLHFAADNGTYITVPASIIREVTAS